MTDEQWTPEQLASIGRARELEVSVARRSGEPGPWTPIWVVVAGAEVLVRTWQRRDTGWYGRARRSGRAAVRVPGLVARVRVQQHGDVDRAAVDAAFTAKYGSGGASSMTTDEAAASTLRLVPGE